MKSKIYKWNNYEIVKVLLNIDKEDDELSNMLNISNNEIMRMKFKLKNHLSKKRKNWKDWEEYYISRNMHKPNKEIAKILNRSISSIANRVQIVKRKKGLVQERRDKRELGFNKRSVLKIILKENMNYELRKKEREYIKVKTLKCIKNYKNFILFQDKNGLKTCILKSDLYTKEIKIKEVA